MLNFNKILSLPTIKVFSSFFTDLAAAWFIAAFAASNVDLLTRSLAFSTMALYLAITLERTLNHES
jgi:hypothetical protein